MVRRYAEPITVQSVTQLTGPPGAEDGPGIRYAVGPPAAFQWRGRSYRVRAVLAHWRERRSWWREIFDAAEPAEPPRPGTRIAAAARERHVWRVEAVSGSVGVFELACDESDPPSSSQWQLLRVAD